MPAGAPSDNGAVVYGVVDVGGWVAPAMELIYEQGTPAFRGQWPRIESMLEFAPPRLGRGDWAHPALQLRAEPTGRVRRDAWGGDDASVPAPVPVPAVAPGVLHDNPAGRVAELDGAGVALQLISPGPTIDACTQLPSNLAAGAFAAYNRYMTAYCSDHPQRLGAVLQLHGSEPRWSAHEVAELRGEPSVRAVSLCLDVGSAPMDRQLDPVWESLAHAGLPLLHRPSFCARVWTPGRLLAYLRDAGVLERFPGLRVAFLGGDGLAAEVTRSIEPAASRRGVRLFAAVSSTELGRGGDGEVAMLWASDFPLRGSLGSELEIARQALGTGAEEVLVAAPRRFLTSP